MIDYMVNIWCKILSTEVNEKYFDDRELHCRALVRWYYTGS